MTRIVRASNPKIPSPRRAVPQPRMAEPTPSLRPYARGVASGMILMGLLGCLPETPKTSFEPAMQPRDVRVQLPSEKLARSGAREGERGGAEEAPATEADEFASRPATMEDLGAWMASSAKDAPRRLEEMNRKTRDANAELARRANAKPTAQPAPEPTPAPASQPTPQPASQPAPKRTPASAPPVEAAAERTPDESTPTVLARPAAPPIEPVTKPSAAIETPAQPVVEPPAATPASVLAAAMGEAFAKHAKTAAISRPVAQAVADAIGAISDPARPFTVTDYPGLDEEETLFVTRLHEASAEVGRDLAAGKPLGEAVARLAEAIKAAEPAKPLLVRRSEFATRVDGFGQLQPITNRRFLPGRQNQIILYNEIDGFTSERGEKGDWTTMLATRIQILAKHDGTEVWNRNWLAVTDTSTVRREDFFVCEKVVLSEYLTVGTYILKTSVRDERTGAIAERSVEFSMVADPALAAR